MNKKCFKCKKIKSSNQFYVHKQMGDGHLGKCKDCTCKDARDNRAKNREKYNESDKYRYRQNVDRMLASKYDGMRRRVLGLAKHSKTTGKELLDENKFMNWSNGKGKGAFIRLYDNWKKSGYQRKFAPSIDRINNKIGYVLGNLQWLTQQENSSKYNK